MEKEYVAPRGDTSRMPIPHPSSQADTLKYMAHARAEIVDMSILTLSAMRSASAYPLTAFAG
jgi:hypothetical protein